MKARELVGYVTWFNIEMRYFFDIYDGGNCARDERGIECFDDMHARRQAVLSLVEMAREYIPADGASMALTVRVRKAEQVAFTVRLDFSTEPGPGLVDARVVQEHYHSA